MNLNILIILLGIENNKILIYLKSPRLIFFKLQRKN